MVVDFLGPLIDESLEGQIGEATVALLRQAIQHILFTQGKVVLLHRLVVAEIVLDLHHLRLHGGRAREYVATAARSLILDTRHQIHRTPIETARRWLHIGNGALNLGRTQSITNSQSQQGQKFYRTLRKRLEMILIDICLWPHKPLP